MSFRIIIPSKDARNLRHCLAALNLHEPGASVIVVDDGLDWEVPEQVGTLKIGVIKGIKPFIFSRNVNLGITAAGDDDVIVLNDDALLGTPNGFKRLAECAKLHPEYGIVGPAANRTGNPNQCPRWTGALRFEKRILCFVCVYIPRTTIDVVGLLDERFGGVDARGRMIYGHEDDDYCYRVRLAGLKLGVYDGCLIDHTKLRSTFRSQHPCPLEPGRELFIQKWGSYPL